MLRFTGQGVQKVLPKAKALQGPPSGSGVVKSETGGAIAGDWGSAAQGAATAPRALSIGARSAGRSMQRPGGLSGDWDAPTAKASTSAPASLPPKPKSGGAKPPTVKEWDQEFDWGADAHEGSEGQKEGRDAEWSAEEWQAWEQQQPPAKVRKVGKAAPARPPQSMPMGDAPVTPGAPKQRASKTRNEQQIRDEKPDWASRCTIDAAKPGQPQRLTVSMAETDLGDEDISEWCDWMDRRLTADNPEALRPQMGGKARFKATTIDFAENKLTIAGIKSLCTLLEKYGIRCEVLRLTGNNLGNEAVRCVAKYLTSASQAPATELHLSRNKVTPEGVKWLLASLAMHPAYPIWNNDTQRYIPLWIRIENAKVKGELGYAALESACSSFNMSVCLGEESGDAKCGPKQCVNGGCCDELKHNCSAHLCMWKQPDGAVPLPSPSAHARPIFAPAGRAALKALPSGVIDPVRDEPRVIYEDDDLAVVFKPAGWSCLPDPKGVDPKWARLKPLVRRQQVAEFMSQSGNAAIQAWLLLHFGANSACEASRCQASDRGLAHRLDADTSGPVLVGKTIAGYDHARKQVALGLIKDYIALVHGSFSTDRGECRAPIDTSTYADTKRVRVDASGQSASTVWEAIAEYESPDRQEKYTLVHLRMVTQRTQQIRVHMQYLGHPLVGDKLYGTGDVPAWCPRLFLHKSRIGFFNTSGETCVESCSLHSSPELWKALGRLRKVGGMAMMGCGAPGL